MIRYEVFLTFFYLCFGHHSHFFGVCVCVVFFLLVHMLISIYYIFLFSWPLLHCPVIPGQSTLLSCRYVLYIHLVINDMIMLTCSVALHIITYTTILNLAPCSFILLILLITNKQVCVHAQQSMLMQSFCTCTTGVQSHKAFPATQMFPINTLFTTFRIQNKEQCENCTIQTTLQQNIDENRKSK